MMEVQTLVPVLCLFRHCNRQRFFAPLDDCVVLIRNEWTKKYINKNLQNL